MAVAGARPLLTGLLPSAVVHVERVGPASAATLLGAEMQAMQGAPPQRRRQFATVRGCARAALAQLDAPVGALLPDRRGAPRWPAGVIGSMTHCEGYSAAAVARTDDVIAVGIDAEPDLPLPPGLHRDVMVPRERRGVERRAANRCDVNLDRLVFSAKESVFKLWYPLVRSELGFDEVVIILDHSCQQFTARLRRPAPAPDGRTIRRLEGRWASRGGLLVTATAVPAAPQ